MPCRVVLGWAGAGLSSLTLFLRKGGIWRDWGRGKEAMYMYWQWVGGYLTEIWGGGQKLGMRRRDFQGFLGWIVRW